MSLVDRLTRKDASKAASQDNAKVIVLFTRAYDMYNAGEIAGFSPEEAERLTKPWRRQPPFARAIAREEADALIEQRQREQQAVNEPPEMVAVRFNHIVSCWAAGEVAFLPRPEAEDYCSTALGWDRFPGGDPREESEKSYLARPATKKEADDARARMTANSPEAAPKKTCLRILARELDVRNFTVYGRGELAGFPESVAVELLKLRTVEKDATGQRIVYQGPVAERYQRQETQPNQ